MRGDRKAQPFGHPLDGRVRRLLAEEEPMKRIYSHPCAACGEYDFAFHDGEHSCKNYQWVCDACGIQMNLAFSDGGSAVMQTPTGRRCERTLALFRVVGAPQIMFIYQGCSWDGALDHDYYYHEGTCPVNLLRCEKIIAEGNPDPHGLFELVAEHLITGPRARPRNEVLDELTSMAKGQTKTPNV